MPIFEFDCRACGEHFEQLVLPWWDNAGKTPDCPACKSSDVERALSICAVSSENTRQTNLARARTKSKKIAREKEVEEFKQAVEHANEHH
jgi:putative FmdB family regulatory protein